MKKRTVLYILNTGTYSGAENVVITMINVMKDDVDAVYLSLEGKIRDVLIENNIKFYAVNKLSVSAIKKAVSEIQPDIIHANDFTAGILSTIAVRNIPIINHLHNNSPWIKNYGIYSFIYAFSCKKYCKILTVSNSIMDEYVFGSKFQNKTEIVGNPINLDVIRRKSDMQLSDWDDRKLLTDVVFLGRLDPQKNILFFLDIINQLKKKIPTLKISIIGDGELRKDVENKITELCLDNNVTMLGFQNNPFPILKQAKAMCMPSLWEGFGLAAVEALSLGVPVVASPVGGLKEIINDDCGKLCADLDEYVAELYMLIEDKNYHCNKSNAARKRAEEYNNYKAYAEKILKIYDEIS